MKIFLTALMLCLLPVKHVHSLDCYATDFTALKARNVNLVPIIQSCNEFVREEIFNTSFRNEEDFRCFTAKIDSDKANFAVQGCTVQDSCGAIVNIINLRKWMFIEKHFYLNNITCSECKGPLCNGGITRSVIMKNWISFERKKYLTAVIIIVMGFVTVVSIMLRVFSRKLSVVALQNKQPLLKV